ncbi:MAG TPA: hypothetical protein VHX36_06690 [Candidatus Acidoferrales bacterium]|jgi:hypothetical protein|nr:hypothetical protein [Candidatus Acidoferrales bacterium]
MSGKAYYLTTLRDWQRHSTRFASSHFVVLGANESVREATGRASAAEGLTAQGEGATILALIEADEGVHLSLEDDPTYEPLPHPLAQKPLSSAVQAALAPHGSAPATTAFEATELIARIHPLLRYRVF